MFIWALELILFLGIPEERIGKKQYYENSCHRTVGE